MQNRWTARIQKQINTNQCSHREGLICNITVKRVNNMNNAASENVGDDLLWLKEAKAVAIKVDGAPVLMAED